MFSEETVVSAILYYRRGLLTYEELLLLVDNELDKLRGEVEDCPLTLYKC